MFIGLHPWIAHNTHTSTALKKVCAHKGLYLKNGYCQTRLSRMERQCWIKVDVLGSRDLLMLMLMTKDVTDLLNV